MTLVVLAAGMGSRYKGLKQIDPISKAGEFIIDFSVYDAIKSGYNKVVFIIKRDLYETFKETIGSRLEKYIKVEYVFQERQFLDGVDELRLCDKLSVEMKKFRPRRSLDANAYAWVLMHKISENQGISSGKA